MYLAVQIVGISGGLYMDFEPLKTKEIEAELEVYLFSGSFRDRPGYKSGIRPNHWIPGRNYCFIGELTFPDREMLIPDETCNAKGKLIVAEQDLPSFIPGFAWHICEANKIMGYVKVLNVIK